MEQYRILVVDDEVDTLDSTKRLLERNGYLVETALTGKAGLEKYKLFNDELAIALVDFKLPDGEGTDIAIQMRKINPDPSVIIFSCHRDEDILHKTIKSRSIEYVSKLGTNEELLKAIGLGIEEFEKNRKVKPFIPKNEIQKVLQSYGIVTQNEAVFTVGQTIERFKEKDIPVLIKGETGVGKELVAKALHYRRSGKFVNVDCTKLSDESDVTLSELFGHEKGAFTGAVDKKVGLIELANNGTLFLDELHHLSSKGQRILLRTLEDKKIRRVGGNIEIHVNFRLVAAVKPNVLDLVKSGALIPDLYYRLKGMQIDIPSLRERVEDIEPLCFYFLKQLAIKNNGVEKTILKQTVAALEKFSWPGNIRELKLVIDAAYHQSQKLVITPADIDPGIMVQSGVISLPDSLDEMESNYEENRKAMILSSLSALC